MGAVIDSGEEPPGSAMQLISANLLFQPGNTKPISVITQNPISVMQNSDPDGHDIADAFYGGQSGGAEFEPSEKLPF